MKPNEEKFCLICETEVEEGLRKFPNKALYFEKFNGDLIPVCNQHKGLLKKEHLDDIINE